MRKGLISDTARLYWLGSTKSQVIWVPESSDGTWVVLSRNGNVLSHDQYSIRAAIDSAMRAAVAIGEIVSQTPRVG